MPTDMQLRARHAAVALPVPPAGRSASARSPDATGGFTLIELLVVVLIIGVLASIAIPGFAAARSGAKDAVLQAVLAHAKQATLGWAGANDATGLPAIDAQLRDWGYTASGYGGPGVRPAYKDGSTAALFCIVGTSETGQQYSVTSHGSVRKGFCPFSTGEW